MKILNKVILISALTSSLTTLSASNLTVDFMTNCAQEKSMGLIAFCSCQWEYITLKYTRAELEKLNESSLSSIEFKEFIGTIAENEDKCYALSKFYNN